MASFLIAEDQLLLHLTWSERLLGLHGDLRVPLSAVRSVRVSPNAWLELRGWRMAGVTIPGSVALGTRRHRSGFDFMALHRLEPAVQVDLSSGRFDRIVASTTEAEATAALIAEAAGIAYSPD